MAVLASRAGEGPCRPSCLLEPFPGRGGTAQAPMADGPSTWLGLLSDWGGRGLLGALPAGQMVGSR